MTLTILLTRTDTVAAAVGARSSLVRGKTVIHGVASLTEKEVVSFVHGFTCSNDKRESENGFYSNREAPSCEQ